MIYLRKSEYADFFPPFALLYVVTGWLALVHGHRWVILALGLALADLVRLCFSTLAASWITGERQNAT